MTCKMILKFQISAIRLHLSRRSCCESQLNSSYQCKICPKIGVCSRQIQDTLFVVAGDFWRVRPVQRRVCRDVMVKCSEPIVVAHSGLAAKQYVGTRGHPATLTDKTALVLGQWVLGGGEQGEQGERGERGSCGGLGRAISDRATLWCNVTTRRPTKSRSTRIIRGRHGRLCWDGPLQSSVWHSDGRPLL